jgi:tRNA (cytidine/uridine-2'-O-)-methyltransferase
MRTAMATGSFLHIIGPLTFELSDKTLKRTGLDYIHQLKWKYYGSYDLFMSENNRPTLYCITRYGNRVYSEVDFNAIKEDIYLIFGAESSGLSDIILSDHRDRLLRIPMVTTARSLNVSNTVALVVYEVLRQQGFAYLSTFEAIKGKDFLSKKIGD